MRNTRRRSNGAVQRHLPPAREREPLLVEHDAERAAHGHERGEAVQRWHAARGDELRRGADTPHDDDAKHNKKPTKVRAEEWGERDLHQRSFHDITTHEIIAPSTAPQRPCDTSVALTSFSLCRHAAAGAITTQPRYSSNC
jgi:hypothetical protein